MNQVAPIEQTSLVNFIERAALDPTIDIAKLEALLKMQREVVLEQDRRAFNRAMSAAQKEMLPVIRDSTNPAFKSKYAKLETIDAQMRPIYTAHGFNVRYKTGICPRDGWMRVICVVSHDDGYYEESYLDSDSAGSANKTSVQAIGSIVSYLRRYLLLMVFNIVTAADPDDDGEAMRRESVSRPPPRPAPPATPADKQTAWLYRLFNAIHYGKTTEEKVSIFLSAARKMTPDQQRALAASADWNNRVGALFPPDSAAIRVALDELIAAAEDAEEAELPPPGIENAPENQGDEPS